MTTKREWDRLNRIGRPPPPVNKKQRTVHKKMRRSTARLEALELPADAVFPLIKWSRG